MSVRVDAGVDDRGARERLHRDGPAEGPLRANGRCGATPCPTPSGRRCRSSRSTSPTWSAASSSSRTSSTTRASAARCVDAVRDVNVPVVQFIAMFIAGDLRGRQPAGRRRHDPRHPAPADEVAMTRHRCDDRRRPSRSTGRCASRGVLVAALGCGGRASAWPSSCCSSGSPCSDRCSRRTARPSSSGTPNTRDVRGVLFGTDYLGQDVWSRFLLRWPLDPRCWPSLSTRDRLGRRDHRSAWSPPTTGPRSTTC